MSVHPPPLLAFQSTTCCPSPRCVRMRARACCFATRVAVLAPPLCYCTGMSSLQMCCYVETGLLADSLGPSGTSVFRSCTRHVSPCGKPLWGVLSALRCCFLERTCAPSPVACAGVGSERQATTSTLYGTPGYIAPELSEGDHPSPLSDAYALGVTIIQVRTHPVQISVRSYLQPACACSSVHNPHACVWHIHASMWCALPVPLTSLPVLGVGQVATGLPSRPAAPTVTAPDRRVHIVAFIQKAIASGLCPRKAIAVGICVLQVVALANAPRRLTTSACVPCPWA